MGDLAWAAAPGEWWGRFLFQRGLALTYLLAFVGTARRGPVDTPVSISNFTEFERTFSGLVRDSGLGYAVRDFYLNGGDPAIVVRVAHDDAAAATIDLGTALRIGGRRPPRRARA